MHACTCLVTQTCLTLCDPVGCILPVSSVRGILQARILKWVPYPFYKGSSQLRDQTWVSCITGRFFTIWAIREPLVPQFKIQYLSFYRHHKYLFIITKYKSIKLRKHIWFWHFNFNTTSFLFLLYLSKCDTLPKTKCSKYEFIVIVFDIWVPWTGEQVCLLGTESQFATINFVVLSEKHRQTMIVLSSSTSNKLVTRAKPNWSLRLETWPRFWSHWEGLTYPI